MTVAEHNAQRETVRRSLLLAGTRADRRDGPVKRRRVVVVVPSPVAVSVPAHVYVFPVVVEMPR